MRAALPSEAAGLPETPASASRGSRAHLANQESQWVDAALSLGQAVAVVTAASLQASLLFATAKKASHTAKDGQHARRGQHIAVSQPEGLLAAQHLAPAGVSTALVVAALLGLTLRWRKPST